MTEGNGWWIVVAIIAASVKVSVLWFYLRKNMPPQVAEIIAEAVARFRNVATEAEVRAFAEGIWDKNIGGVQNLAPYYDKEKFVALVVRAVLGAIAEQSMVEMAMGWSGASGEVET